jgi:hypothetical protein
VPNALSDGLRRMTSNLRAAGIEIQFSRADIRGRRVVSLGLALPSPGKDRQLLSVVVIVASDPRKMAESPRLFHIFRRTPVKTRWKATDGH